VNVRLVTKIVDNYCGNLYLLMVRISFICSVKTAVEDSKLTTDMYSPGPLTDFILMDLPFVSPWFPDSLSISAVLAKRVICVGYPFGYPALCLHEFPFPKYLLVIVFNCCVVVVYCAFFAFSS